MLEISKENVMALFNKGNQEVKDSLELLFGKDTFKKQSIIDRVKTLLDVYEITKPIGELLELVSYGGKNRHIIGAQHFAIAELICEALNEGWIPDWTDTDQEKWYPVFDGAAGFGFSYSDCDYWDSFATVGSRLCLKNEKLATYAGKQFNSIFKEILTK